MCLVLRANSETDIKELPVPHGRSSLLFSSGFVLWVKPLAERSDGKQVRAIK